MSILELMMWKIKLDDSRDLDDAMGGGSNKMKTDLSDFRLQCCISCGADHVVEIVWPYILPPDYVRCECRRS